MIQLDNGIYRVVANIGIPHVARENTEEILRIGGVHLLDMIVGYRTL